MPPLHSRGSPTKGKKIRTSCLSHAFSEAQKWAEVLWNPCILRGPQQRATKRELAESNMPSRGPKSGRRFYVTPAFSGVPNKGEQNQNWLPQPCLLGGRKVVGSSIPPLHSSVVPNKGEQNHDWLPQPCLREGPKVGESAASSLQSRRSPLHSGGSPPKGDKIRIGCLNHAFSRGQKWANLLRHPCILRGPQQRGTKSELAASVMPPRKPKNGRKCYVTAAFSGVLNKGEQNQNWRPQPCLLRAPKVGGSAMSPLHSRGSSPKGIKMRIGCLSHAFSGGQKWPEVLCHPCILEGPQQRATKSELAASAMPSWGVKSGWKFYLTPAFSGIPNKGQQNQNWLPPSCLLGGPKVGGVLCHRCILGGPQQRGTNSELAASAMPSQGPKSGRKCYVTPAFSGVPNKGEQNQNWLPKACLLGGPKVDVSATSPMHSRGSPTKGN